MRFKAGSSKWLLSFIGIASVAMLAMGGCTKEGDDSTSVTNPNPDPFRPVGTIQGVVRDRVTLEPIVNAKVTIDVGSFVTDSTGSYHIDNVAAGDYTIQVDLRNATNAADVVNGAVEKTLDVNMVDEDAKKEDIAATGGDDDGICESGETCVLLPRYPDIVYVEGVEVDYDSLNDTENCSDDTIVNDETACGDNASNHDTPVDRLVTNVPPIGVGKLSCSITGTVYGCDVSADPTTSEYATVQSPVDVRLESNENSENSATGAPGNILNQVTTTTGAFTFDNVQCGNVELTIVAAAPSFDDPLEHRSINVSSPEGDGETLVLHLEQDEQPGPVTELEDPAKDQVLHLCPNDDIGPQIIAISPEPGSDLAINAEETVVITFHEPVFQDAYSSLTGDSQVDASPATSLFRDIRVNADDTKAGNLAYRAEWNDAVGEEVNGQLFNQLTITFATEASTLYNVRVPNVGSLTDAADNPAEHGVCPTTAPGPWVDFDDGSIPDDDCIVYFSTGGGDIPDQITTLVLQNAPSLNEATSSTPSPTQVGQYDWSIVSGAKDYTLYCQIVQVWAGADGLMDTTDDIRQAGPYVRDNLDLGLLADGILITGSSARVHFDILADASNDNVAFVENNEVSLEYNCVVAGINSDGVEGPVSDPESAEDAIGPELVPDGGGALTCTGGNTGTVTGSGPFATPTAIGTICNLAVADGGDGDLTTIDQIIVGYNEVMTEAAAETVGNYTVNSAPLETVDTANYNVANDMVLLTLTDPVNPLSLTRATLTGGADGVIDSERAIPGDTTTEIANTGFAGDDILTRPTCVTEAAADQVEAVDDFDTTPGQGGGIINVGPNGICDTTATAVGAVNTETPGEGQANGPCVGPGVDGDQDTIAPFGGDDADSGNFVNSGTNGVCQTAAAVGDEQLVPIGEGHDATSINTGPNMVLDSVLTPDDVITRAAGVTVGPLVTDVGGNAVQTDENELTTDGNVQ